MATESDQLTNGSVFISYSRKDKEFVRKLYDGLVSKNVKAWVDWEGIPLSADWMEEITRAVNGADAFLVILSPDWLASKVCLQELELGLKNDKKLIPILYRPPEPGTDLPDKVAATNWVYLRPEDDFDSTLLRLVEAINTDLDWVRDHTRLLQRAVEWDSKARNPSFLLRGTDLQEAEGWMNQAAMNAKRQVLALQSDYILIGRKEAVARQRITTIAISLALVVSVVLGVIAVFQWREADIAKTEAFAQRNAAEAQYYQGKGGSLDTSTLLAIDSLETADTFQAEDIIRQNLSYMPIPVNQMQELPNNEITNIEFSPDESTFATNGLSGQACLWHADTNVKQYCVTQGKAIYDAVFTRDGKFLVTSSDDGFVNFWNMGDGKLSHQLPVAGQLPDLEVSQDGKWLAIAGESKITLVNLQDDQALPQEILQQGLVEVVRISPDSQWLGAGTYQGQVSLIRLGNNVSEPVINHDGQEVLAIAFSPDNRQMVSAGADNKARVWDLQAKKEILTLSHGDWVEDVIFSPDGKMILAAADDNRVWRWNVASGQPQPRLHHEGFALKARFSPFDGRWIASTGADKTMRVWDTVSGSQMLEASLDDRGSSLAFSPDGSRVIVGDRSGHITVWQISSINARVSTIQFLDLIHEIKAAPTGEFFIVNTDDKNVRAFPFADLLQIRSDTEGKDLFSAGGLTYSLEISPDVKWIAAAEKDQSRTLLYHIEDGKTTLLQQGSKVTDVAFTPDNAKLFTAGMDNKILIWDVHSGEKLAELVSTAPVLSIGVSVDGQYLVAGLDGREANMVWDLSTNQPLEAGLPQSGSAGQIAFSPDGRWLATGDNKGYILLWDMSRISEPEIINVHEYKQNGEVKSLLFSPDGAWLLSGSDDGFVHIWDITSNNELARLPHTNPVTGLAFSQDTKYLMVASLKVIQIWNRDGIELIQHENLVDVACQRLVVNLSQTDWEDVYGDAPYEKICPGLPQAKN